MCVGSFSARRIAAVRRALGPQLCTALGPRAALRLRLPGARGRPAADRRLTGRCAQVPARLGPRPLRRCRLPGRRPPLWACRCTSWTVNDRAEMIRLLDLGVDGIMTDRADVLRDLLVERGQWPTVYG